MSNGGSVAVVEQVGGVRVAHAFAADHGRFEDLLVFVVGRHKDIDLQSGFRRLEWRARRDIAGEIGEQHISEDAEGLGRP